MPLGTEVNLGPGDDVLDGVAAPHEKGTAGWMKTPTGTEVDLGSGHNVLDGVQAPRESGYWAL